MRTPADAHGHGTHVTGIIAAGMSNGHGSTGIAPDITIMPIRVLNASNSGTWADAAAGIVYAADNGARIINLSLGGQYPSNVIQQAVQYAAGQGVFMVAASGNLPDGEPFFPAAYPEVFAVSATDRYDQWWTSSSYGSWVDISAPGDQIWSTNLSLNGADNYAFKSGTSMAAPFVSGVAALLLSAHSDLTVDDLRVILERSADDKGTPEP